jgi:hypothetical protein
MLYERTGPGWALIGVAVTAWLSKAGIICTYALTAGFYWPVMVGDGIHVLYGLMTNDSMFNSASHLISSNFQQQIQIGSSMLHNKDSNSHQGIGIDCAFRQFPLSN